MEIVIISLLALMLILMIPLLIRVMKKEAPMGTDQKEVTDALKVLDVHVKDSSDKIAALEKNALLSLKEALNNDIEKIRLALAEEAKSNIDRTHSFQRSQNDLLEKRINEIRETLEKKLGDINGKVEEKLEKGFATANATFNEVMESLTRIEEAKKKMEDLSLQVVNLQSILQNSQSRGQYGEMQLTSILDAVFEGNRELYQTQFEFTHEGRKYRPDAVVFLHGDDQKLCIDSKFPLIGTDLTEDEKKALKKSITDRIKEVSQYVIGGQTFSQAFMFVPSDGILAYIHQNHPDLILLAQKHHVAITSPATLLPTLAAIKSINLTVERSKVFNEVQRALLKLSSDFEKFGEGWKRFAKNVQTTLNGTESFGQDVSRLTKDFRKINEVGQITNNNELVSLEEE